MTDRPGVALCPETEVPGCSEKVAPRLRAGAATLFPECRRHFLRIARHFSAGCFVWLLLLLSTLAHAQNADPFTPAQIAARIHTQTPKTVCLVFDVSASTKSGGVFARERAASATVIRDGCVPGDRVVLFAFGTGTRTVFDKTLASHADAAALVDLLPGTVAAGQGTNIRWPHAQALQSIQEGLPHPGVVVLLTDSFNDRPLPTDPSYPKYLEYYSLKSLTQYPDTQTNRDYERLLRTLKASGKLSQYGVGVGIAENGRPIERLPLAAGMDTTNAGNDNLQPTVLAPTGTEKPAPSLVLPVALGLAALGIGAAFWFLRSRPVSLRLRLGEKNAPRDYSLRPGQTVQIGGTTNPNGETFPLAGVSTAQAVFSVVRGGLVLTSTDGANVFHNGARVREPVPVKTGDEVRVVLPATENVAPREFRIRVEDPRGAAF